MKLKALASYRYGNRILSVGDTFTPSPVHGRLLVALRRAAYITEEIKNPKTKRRSRKTSKEPTG